MFRKFNKVISLLLVFTMILSNMCSVVFAADVPEASNPGDGGFGSFTGSGIFVKALFYDPKSYGVTDANFNSKVGRPSQLTNFKTVSSRTIFEIGSKQPVMKPPKYGSNEEDSRELAQMYSGSSLGNNQYVYAPIRFLADGNDNFTSFASTNHYAIVANKMNGASIGGYTSEQGLFSMNSVYMKELLKATKNGEVWDKDAVSATIRTLWDTYVDPNAKSNTDTSAVAIRYRGEFASLFADGVQGGQNMEAPMNFINNLFNTKINKGTKPPGWTTTIKTDAQAANIQNLFMACFGLVLGNPAGGTNIGGTVVQSEQSYKGKTILNNMLRWAGEGGNSDFSSYHFALKFEVYAFNNATSTSVNMHRWDMSLYNACAQSNLGLIAVTPGYQHGPTDIRYYGYDGDYTFSTAKTFYEAHWNSVIAAHRAKGLNIGRKSTPQTGTSFPRADAMVIFQVPYLGVDATFKYPLVPSTYNYRGLMEFKSEGYYNGAKTMNLGYAFLAPVNLSAPPQENGTSQKPNLKLDSTVFTNIVTIPKDDTATATSYTGFMYPEKLSDSTIKDLGLKVTSDNWRSRYLERDILLLMIDRASLASNIQGSTVNSKLPVKLTIKRTIINGDSTKDSKIIDKTYADSTIIQHGSNEHNFKIDSDDGTTAVISFTLIPNSANSCTRGEYTIISPLKLSQGLKGDAAKIKIKNCAISTLFEDASSRIKFDDTGIKITNTPGGTTTVNYDFSVKIDLPKFKTIPLVYGDSAKDQLTGATMINGLGYVNKPVNGLKYPESDWKEPNYTMSPTIRRSVNFVRESNAPTYSNLGYENKNPHYAEIKQGSSTYEKFEAMAGTPTTENLYTSVSGTDFRVDFKASDKPRVNPATERTYTYKYKVTKCWGANGNCTVTCPGHGISTECSCLVAAAVPPKPDGSGGSDAKYCTSGSDSGFCTSGSVSLNATCSEGKSVSKTFTATYKPGDHDRHVVDNGCVHEDVENSFHPSTHEYTYVLKMPIESFTYFDIENSEVWRLSEWGINDISHLLTNGNLKYDMKTKLQGYNAQDYVAGNGRLLFSKNQKGSTESNFTNNTISDTFEHNAATCTDGAKKAMDKANLLVKAEDDYKATVVSDYIVLTTSEGYQVPYFFTQETSVISPKSTPFTESPAIGESVEKTLTTPAKVGKQLTIDDFWFKNNSKLTCASKENGWGKTSITYGGYNGGYSNLSTKYKNIANKSFINFTNPIDKLLTDNGLSVNTTYPNQVSSGSTNTSFGLDAGNKEHIKYGLDVKDTLPNGEYDTGKAYVKYDRVMFYKDNIDQGSTSSTAGKFDMTSPGVWLNSNVPYFNEAEKINNIVLHNPVSAEGAIVKSNDKIYDLRTNDNLMQGGDPGSILGGVCPLIGCEFSELTCTTPLKPHVQKINDINNEDCYNLISEGLVHMGGNNTHVCNDDCKHKHTDECYTIGGGDDTGGSCICVHCNNPFCDNFCSMGEANDTVCNIECPQYAEVRIKEYTDMYVPSLYSNRPVEDTGYNPVDIYNTEYGGAHLDGEPNDGKAMVITRKVASEYRTTSTNVAFRLSEFMYEFNIRPSTYAWNNTPAVVFKKGEDIDINIHTSQGSGIYLDIRVLIAYKPEKVLICEKKENTCTLNPNFHKCTFACRETFIQTLICVDPHHYLLGENTNQNDPNYHYQLGDPRCWTRCGDDSKHGQSSGVTLPDGSTASSLGAFVNLDREFSVYFPFIGDFAKNPSLEGISETTDVNGKGYTNGMNTRAWTGHRWVNFPINVIDPNGNMRLAFTQIDLNDFSETDTEFTFYCVLANEEMSQGSVKFTATANNTPNADRDAYFDDSSGNPTNKDKVDYKYAARHSGSKYQYIDVVGSIGSLTINDTGDFRFANFFKKTKSTDEWIVKNLIKEVHLGIPNNIVADYRDVRFDSITKPKGWLSTYGSLYQVEGGKSGGSGNNKQPYVLPLVPRYNNIPSLRNQPMRPGYQLYLDTETIGNYYGETLDEVTSKLLDSQMRSKMQIRPTYYSLDLNTNVYTPVDVYYGVNGEYMKVNDYNFSENTNEVGVQNYYYYLDWLNESLRRNTTNEELLRTNSAKEFRAEYRYYDPSYRLRSPRIERDILGSANVLFLNDLNRTFLGSSKTNGLNRNPGGLLDERYYNMQSQRWHYSLGLPSSAVFVESGVDCTETNIKQLQTGDRVIVSVIDVKVEGDVWTLDYRGNALNNDTFRITEDGREYIPPKFDIEGNPTTDPTKDVTSDDPIVVIYPPNKTSKDDIQSNGIQ